MPVVWLASVNYRYGANAFLPYSVGRLWAYVETIPELKEAYRLGGLLFDRTPVTEVVERMAVEGPPDVLGVSAYVWNWEYGKRLAEAVKTRWPGCLVVMGGPQVPDRSQEENFFGAHPYVDILVHGEGELAFAEILRFHLSGEGRLAHITQRLRLKNGFSFREGGRTIRTGPSNRTTDLASLPSPYLAGVFDVLVVAHPDVAWQALQETNRGCPYRCTFCDWGSATFTKVTKFPIDPIRAELAWFADHKIELLYNCDANFGMLEQDTEIADALVESKARTGYPKLFRAAYAKKITPRVFEVAKTLSDAGMSKGATISFQSLDPDVLANVKRLNPVQRSLRETFARYNEAGVPTYTEMILGLPGETYASFREGLEELLQAGQHHGINVYPCMALRNSEMSRPDYVAEHGLQTVWVPMLLLHGTVSEGDVREYYDLVVSTSAMPLADWRRAYLLAWIVQALHCQGLTDVIARGLVESGRVRSYTDLYERLLEFGAETVGGSEVGRRLYVVERMLDRVLAGGEWWTEGGGVFGAVSWPPEEYAYLCIMLGREAFYRELKDWLYERDGVDVVAAVLEQMSGQLDPFEDFGGDLERFAREVVWYGRKGRKPAKQEARQENQEGQEAQA